MKKIQILRSINYVRFLVFTLFITLLIISLLFPITMFLLHPSFGIIGTSIYFYLAYRVFYKLDYFKGKVHSIDTNNNKLIIICFGFFKLDLKEYDYKIINDLVLERHEVAIPLNFRYFELSAMIDGNKRLLAKYFIRKDINEVAKSLISELNLCVSLKDADELRLIDSRKYNFSNLEYNYSYSPIFYLINGLVYAAILPIGGLLPYICLPVIIWSFMNYFKSRQNLKKINT